MSYVLKVTKPEEFVVIQVEKKDEELNIGWLQQQVGGMIEICYNPLSSSPDHLIGLCDEEGLLKELSPTMMTTERGTIVGPILWVIQDEDLFVPMDVRQKDLAALFLTEYGFTEKVIH